MDFIIINKLDNVGVSLKVPFLPKGTVVLDSVTISEDIPYGHKFSLININKDEKIIKYGNPIGKASTYISAGSHVHTFNVSTLLDKAVNYEYNGAVNNSNSASLFRKVKVYERENKTYGIRNELWIIPTVGCINSVCDNYASLFSKNHKLSKNYDGIKVLTHPYGCSQMGADLEYTTLTLQKLATNPNVGGVLIVGLGCENNQISAMSNFAYILPRTRFVNLQTTSNEKEVVLGLLEELYLNLKLDKRVTSPLSVLKIGMKCGGSDGLSGITANPLIGRFSDYLVSQKASAVLTEVPEMFGAENILMARAKNKDVFLKIVDLINDYKQYYIDHNQVVYDNPSPGNKKGGITTLEEKSLGCIQKGGVSCVVDVVSKDSKVVLSGLNLIKSPGNDLVSVTELTASGCALVLFSTGRGTPFGGMVPTVKISTNSLIYSNKPEWIDFNAGVLVSEEKTMDDLLLQFIEYIIEVINGKKTTNELNNIHGIAIFKDGVTL
ncbi:MAG: altronate dehydratase family protein [Acholeplasmatales bacterium]|jgi:altronate hydrolase|nr:altronate dehydratase family protein [Acholeplasmatales bacterium]